jgi:hypothetical protein
MRRTTIAHHCAVPLAVMVIAGMVHAFFEDWLFAVGYYLCVFFWVGAFWLVDLMPNLVQVAVQGSSGAHPHAQFPLSDELAPIR